MEGEVVGEVEEDQGEAEEEEEGEPQVVAVW